MDLHLEGILETLLVGAIVSLLVLSILFFSMGHVLRVDVVRRFFRFLVCQQDRDETSDPVDVPLFPPSQHGLPAHRPSPSRFVFLVLTALLYGAGVVAESRAHTDQDGHDTAMKLKAFDAVAHGRLASGADPEPRLAHFVADYDACHRTHTSAPLTGSRDLGRLESDRANGNDLSPCNQIDVRVSEFYHNAKNAVLQQKTYNEELVNMQSRINFMRSTYWILYWLSCEMLIVAAIVTLVKLFRGRRRSGGYLQLRILSRKIGRLAFIRHVRSLDAPRCCLMFVALCVFTYATHHACEECESQFDKRIFGYFLSLGDRHGSNDVNGDEGEEESPAPSLESKGAQAREERDITPRSPVESNGFQARKERDITPRSPYFVFHTAGHDPGEHLEPSAVRKMGDGSRVIVANDVNKNGHQMFWLFDVEGDRLVNAERVCTDNNVFGAFGGVEAIYVGDKPDANHSVEVLAAPTFENKKTHELLRFRINAERGAATPKGQDCHAITDVAKISIPNPCDALGKKGGVGCRIEGMTSDDGQDLLFGVHDTLMPSASGSGDQTLKPTIAIVKTTKTGAGWGNPVEIFRDDSLEDGCHHQSGISDLSLRPGGLLYVLTSVDLHDKGTCSEGERPPLPEVAQVRGALWRLDLTHLDKQSRLNLLYRFAHKPAGITDIGDGSLLVVFGDEGQRKSPIWAPRTFALEQNEAVFSVLPAAAERRGMQPSSTPSLLLALESWLQ